MAELTHSRLTGGSPERRRHLAAPAVGFPDPEEAGWITGCAVNANGDHVDH